MLELASHWDSRSRSLSPEGLSDCPGSPSGRTGTRGRTPGIQSRELAIIIPIEITKYLTLCYLRVMWADILEHICTQSRNCGFHRKEHGRVLEKHPHGPKLHLFHFNGGAPVKWFNIICKWRTYAPQWLLRDQHKRSTQRQEQRLALGRLLVSSRDY